VDEAMLDRRIPKELFSVHHSTYWVDASSRDGGDDERMRKLVVSFSTITSETLLRM
jgi:hypothetical protein